jgi:hypothetical protein
MSVSPEPDLYIQTPLVLTSESRTTMIDIVSYFDVDEMQTLSYKGAAFLTDIVINLGNRITVTRSNCFLDACMQCLQGSMLRGAMNCSGD